MLAPKFAPVQWRLNTPIRSQESRLRLRLHRLHQLRRQRSYTVNAFFWITPAISQCPDIESFPGEATRTRP